MQFIKRSDLTRKVSNLNMYFNLLSIPLNAPNNSVISICAFTSAKTPSHWTISVGIAFCGKSP